MWLSAGGWLATLALGILVAPLVTDAQRPTKVWRIGLFHVDYVPLGLIPFPANAMDWGLRLAVGLSWRWR